MLITDDGCIPLRNHFSLEGVRHPTAEEKHQ
jgi:hypothetical protein